MSNSRITIELTLRDGWGNNGNVIKLLESLRTKYHEVTEAELMTVRNIEGLSDTPHDIIRAFVMPQSGWGSFQDYFDARYDEAEAYLLEQNPELKNDDDARISGSCEIAEKKTFEYIASLGLEVIYPPKEN